jgi:hypothetical protein
VSPDIDFNYNLSVSDIPAPMLPVEWRSPASPDTPNPESFLAILDSGADCCAIPQSIIDKLELRQIDMLPVGGYDDNEETMPIKPIYSVHITIHPLKPIVAEVVSKEERRYGTIGRNVINDWLLTLDGPKQKGYIKSEY